MRLANGRTRQPIALVLSASAALSLADAMADVLAPWLALQLGGPVLAGMVAAATFAPAVPASLLGGWLADRMSARPILVAGAAALGVTALLLGLLVMGGLLTPLVLVVIVFLGASLDEPATAAKEARLPSLADAAGIQLHRVNTIDEALKTGAFLMGPALAAFLASIHGLAVAMFAVAGIAMVGALLFAMGPRLHPEKEGQNARGGLLSGVRIIWRNRELSELASGAALAVAVLLAVEAVFAPVLITTRGGDLGDLVWFVLPAGLAAAVAAALYAWRGERVPAQALMLTGLGCLGLALTGLGLWHWLNSGLSRPALVVSGSLIGAGFGAVTPAVSTALQLKSPPEALGAVLGAASALVLAAVPFATLFAGFALIGLSADKCLALVGLTLLMFVAARRCA